MTSRFNAKIEVDAEEKTNAVFDSVNIDTNSIPKIQPKQRCFVTTKLQY